MSRRETPVYAVIPTYNNDVTLPLLLQDVLEQEYNKVFVIDDKSTDHTLWMAEEYRKNIEIIGGSKNLGAAGNRNRIIPELGERAIIHFIDADVRLNSQYSPEKARELGSIANIGFVSGLVRLADGSQNPWNYGPAYSLPQMVSSWLYSGIYKLGESRPAAAHAVRQKLNGWSLMEQWPDTSQPAVARDVYWGTEANMVIPSDVFKGLGGYDPSLRYHEVMELAMRLERLGLRRRFDPSLDVTHESFDLMNNGTSRDFYDAQRKIIAKMGVKKFLMPSRS